MKLDDLVATNLGRMMKTCRWTGHRIGLILPWLELEYSPVHFGGEVYCHGCELATHIPPHPMSGWGERFILRALKPHWRCGFITTDEE